MSFVVPEEISLIVSSNPNNGALRRNANGSYFEVELEEGIYIPKDAENVNISVEEATVWWVIPNIITGTNDKMYITGQPLGGGVPQQFVITIPQGLYDLSGLNQAILRELENAGAETNPSPLINLEPDEATQKVEIKFNYNDVEIDFTQADTPRAILGFNSQVLGPYATAPISILADNVATFNQVDSLLLHSDIVSRGILLNNRYYQIIGDVQIDTTPGSQIISKPFHPARVNATELKGQLLRHMRFWITDQQNRDINMNGEYWSLRLVIHYLRPYVIEKTR